MSKQLQGWFSEEEISSLKESLNMISSVRRSFNEGIRREPSEYRDLVISSGTNEASIIRSLIGADSFLQGKTSSNYQVGNHHFYQIISQDILPKLALNDLYEFSLIADAENDEDAEKLGLEPVLVWIFRRNGHAIIHYNTLTTNRIDSIVVRSSTLKKEPNILCSYAYKMMLDRQEFIFRTQPILLPPPGFSWDKIVSGIKNFTKPSLKENGHFAIDYDKFKTIFDLTTDKWWSNI